LSRAASWALAAWLCAGAATAAPVSCPPADDAYDADPLPHLAAALKPGATLSILAVGSATVFGPEASATADAAPKPHSNSPLQPSQTGFPWQAAHALEASVHGLRVNVTVIGRRGLTAAEMLDRLTEELPKKQYRLVLWQTGTVDAVQDQPPDEFYQTLSDGAAAVAAAGADLVLIDPQFSRFLEANANLAPYAEAMQAAGTLPGVALFHRTALMRDWAEAGAIDLEHTAKGDRSAAATRLHACLGRALATMLLADAAAVN
jgi:hypothetical protein